MVEQLPYLMEFECQDCGKTYARNEFESRSRAFIGRLTYSCLACRDVFRALKRDHMRRFNFAVYGIRCTYCYHFVGDQGEVDHIYPKVLGGSDAPWNRQMLCRHCNRTKHSKTEKMVINAQPL